VSSEGQVIQTPQRLTLDTKDHRIPAVVTTPETTTVFWYGTACGQEEAVRMTSFTDLPVVPSAGSVLEEETVGSTVRLDATAFGEWVFAAWSVDRTVKTLILNPQDPEERLTMTLPLDGDGFKSVFGTAATMDTVAIVLGGATPSGFSVHILDAARRIRPVRR
jgi:hypothetical protein